LSQAAGRRKTSGEGPANVPQVTIAELDEHCALPDGVRRKFLRDNAILAFKLDVPS